MAQLQRLITTNNGGFPLVLDDIRWLEGGIYYAIRQFADDVKSGTGSGLNGAIVSGCASAVVNPTTIDVSAGLVLINNVLYFHPGGSFNPTTIPGGSSVYLTPTSPQAFNSAGLKQFQNGANVNTYEERQCQLVVKATASATADDLLIGPSGRSAFYLDGPAYGILAADYQSGYQAGGGSDAPLFRMLQGKRVQLTGQIEQTGLPSTISTDVHVATIQAPYRPVQNVLVPFIDASGDLGYWEIQQNGEIHVRGDIEPTTPPIVMNLIYSCRR